MNNLQEFKTFYLDIALPNLPSFISWFNESNFDKNINELIKFFYISYDINPFDISDPNEIKNILKDKKEAFASYSDKNGSGVPNALLNTHYFNFLKYKDLIKFSNLQDFIDKLHEALGGFCNTFQKERIKFNGNTRVASNSLIFGDVRDDYWTINKGSEKEIQYHIFKDEDELGYGLGFNAQKSMNNLTPIENVSKFIAAFIQNKDSIFELLKGYEFLSKKIDNLVNIKEGDFIVYGKIIPLKLEETHFILNKNDFLSVYYNLRYRQYVVYKKIFENAISNKLTFNQIIEKNTMTELLKYKKQIILQGPPGTGKTREAKLIAKEIIGVEDVKDLGDSDQFKLIQFHPSYTYEDFVRGIISKPNEDGDGIIYEAENKVLAAFAKEAFENYLDSKKNEDELSYENWVYSVFEKFTAYLVDKLAVENDIELTKSVVIVSVDDDAFRYKGKKGWSKQGNRMLFDDIVRAIIDNSATRKEIKANNNLSGLAKWHASYYIRVVEMFNDFIKEKGLKPSKTVESRIELKNYVLIIDEINRANLSSVLGELIYALEYRGEAANTIYAVEDSLLLDKNKLILPPNLYIIGTMNTADRSVGHIDYAIRRRFAFVDVLPKDLSNDEDIIFDSQLFDQVAALFDTNLSPEFKKEDVQLGHSYFIDKTKEGGSMDIRLEYEIKPILFEYVKDGVFIGEDIKKLIEALEPSI